MIWMTYSYYEIIKTFLDQSQFDMNYSTPWHVDPLDFAVSLLRLIDNPDGINQSLFGFCGEVAFLRTWAYRDPDAVAEFAIELYKTGKSNIGDYKVKACKQLLNSTWIKEHNVPIGAAVWMICGALADSEFNFFEGSPDDDSGTGDNWLALWLKKTNQYYKKPKVYTRNIWGIIPRKSHIDHALKLKPDSYTDVIIVINTYMFVKGKSSPHIAISPSYKGRPHYVALNKPISIVNGNVHISIWTWAKSYELVISKEHFNDLFHGSIVAYSNKPKRANYYVCCEKGETLEKQGKYLEAIEIYDKVIGINPDFARAWCCKGNALRKSKRIGEALKIYDKALNTNPIDGQSGLWYNKGVALGKLDKYEEAIKVYDNAIKMDSRNYAAKSNLRIAQEKLRIYNNSDGVKI